MTKAHDLDDALAQLRSGHDVLPFLERSIPSHSAAFRRMPDEMVDLVVSSPDFLPPETSGVPVWLQICGEEGATLEIIVARSAGDGELWIIAPESQAGDS